MPSDAALLRKVNCDTVDDEAKELVASFKAYTDVLVGYSFDEQMSILREAGELDERGQDLLKKREVRALRVKRTRKARCSSHLG